MGQRSETPGAAHLALVRGAILLHPETAVFDAMLAGWRTQQQSRLLTATTIGGREGMSGGPSASRTTTRGGGALRTSRRGAAR